jgi:hypothetical protein
MSKTSKPRPSKPAVDDSPTPNAPEAGDESGNRALHRVASGPNPNVGRDDVERPPQDPKPKGGVEST